VITVTFLIYGYNAEHTINCYFIDDGAIIYNTFAVKFQYHIRFDRYNRFELWLAQYDAKNKVQAGTENYNREFFLTFCIFF
jgi:hypothetical protein